MRGRLLFATGLATGYVLGARAGRGAYNSLKERVQSASQSPQVQNVLGKAKDLAEERAPKLASAVTSVTGGGSASGKGASTTSTDTASSTTTGAASGLETGSTTGMDTGIVPGVDTDPGTAAAVTLDGPSAGSAVDIDDLDESTTPTATS